MKIALTQKLADAMKSKPREADPSFHPLFCGTAHRIKTFSKWMKPIRITLKLRSGEVLVP